MNNKKRNPVSALQLSLDNATSFLKKLCEFTDRIQIMKKDLMATLYLENKKEEWKEIVLLRKSLWISLVIEIGRIFDTYEKETKKVISFKKSISAPALKEIIDKVHGEAIVCKIIKTRNTFMAHISEQENDILSAEEICDSNLEKLLDELKLPLVMFTKDFMDNNSWKDL